MKTVKCKSCGGEARIGTIEELRRPPRSPGYAVVEREEGEKRVVMTSRCAPAKTKEA